MPLRRHAVSTHRCLQHEGCEWCAEAEAGGGMSEIRQERGGRTNQALGRTTGHASGKPLVPRLLHTDMGGADSYSLQLGEWAWCQWGWWSCICGLVGGR